MAAFLKVKGISAVLLLLLLLTLVVLASAVTSASGQGVPEEFYQNVQIYEHRVSNDELTLSIDKASYKFGETVNVIGLVHDVENTEFLPIFRNGQKRQVGRRNQAYQS